MHIKIPNSMKSPTVVIVGQQSQESNDNVFLRRMDILERKIDQKNRAPKTKDPNIFIERLHKSFMGRLDKFFAMHKAILEKTNDRRLRSLRSELTTRVREVSKSNNSTQQVRRLTIQLNALELAIKKISSPRIIKQNTVRIVQAPRERDQSLDLLSLTILKSMERKMNRQLIPSPS